MEVVSLMELHSVSDSVCLCAGGGLAYMPRGRMGCSPVECTGLSRNYTSFREDNYAQQGLGTLFQI